MRLVLDMEFAMAPCYTSWKREITSLNQGSMTVVAYYSKLKRLWDEINDLEPPAVCTCVAGSNSNHGSLAYCEQGLFHDITEVKRFKKWEDKKTFMNCDHCGVKGHVKENCFKLKGYLSKWGNSKNMRPRFQNKISMSYTNSANVAYMENTPMEFNEGASENENKQLTSLMQTVEALSKEMVKMKEMHQAGSSGNT
ncbi:hypothetical protein LIER_27219 [Lithospermum erythrorhizon]|uniref:Retrotransposon gag domain-containing protein n=1 Tax=Lithospermum erythrorhizon TaxID=34254 RepID=A0AAV3RB79_LITER